MKNLIILLLFTLNLSCAEKMKDGLYAEIQTTLGNITLDLEFEKTPLTVANFVGLAQGTKKSNKDIGNPFYDGVIFHRVIKNFMLQSGDPEGTGRGGPGYRFPDEFHPDLIHEKGVISMANSGPATNGSQFFITHAKTPHLNNKHSVFGRVIKGMETVNAIAETPTIAQDKPKTDVIINSIKITAVGSKAKEFKTDEKAFQTYLAHLSNKQSDLENEKDKSLKLFLDRLKRKHGSIQKTDNGIHYVILRQGKGSKPVSGKEVSVHYVGTFLDGKKFDSSVDRNKPFSFVLGVGRVIPGWDQTVLDMLENEKRLIVLPPKLAYGEKGAGPIPPNSNLVFEIERL